MNNKLKTKLSVARVLIVLLVAVILVGIGYKVDAYYGNNAKVVVEGNYIEASQNQSEPVQEENLSALTSPIITSRYLSIGGIMKYYVSQRMNTATTSLCSIANPFGATTSTLESFDYQITTGTSTAATLVGTLSSLQYASSTATNFAAAQTVASGAQDSFSVTPLIDAGITSPSYFAQLRSEGAGLGGYTYTGKCQAVFRQMP